MSQSTFLARWAALYSNQTPAERALEPVIASLGVPYRVQHPMWGLRIFPDFVLPEHMLVIEVDDPSHNTKKGREKDAERTQKLIRHGWTVVRTTNAAVLADPRKALESLLALPELADFGLKLPCKDV